ncbi:ribonuclease H-like protein, partial [Auricularia subglabra TFB-10046 SS5]
MPRPPPIAPHVAPVPGQSKLDDLLRKTMESSLSSEDGLRALYGSSVLPEEDHIYVYPDGSCQNPGQSWSAAGAGICWGLGSSRNSSHRVPGRQTSPRAELYAVLHALVGADDQRCLCVRTDSEYAIHTLCHWAPALAEAGWTCENGDLIQACVERLAARPRITRFSWVKGHSGNALNDEADRLAALGCA